MCTLNPSYSFAHHQPYTPPTFAPRLFAHSPISPVIVIQSKSARRALTAIVIGPVGPLLDNSRAIAVRAIISHISPISAILVLPPQSLQPLLLGMGIDVRADHEPNEVEERHPRLVW